MRPLIHLTVLLLMLAVLLRAGEGRRLTVTVTAPPTDSVFIAGNRAEFGWWNPAAVPLLRKSDSVWSRTFEIDSGSELLMVAATADQFERIEKVLDDLRAAAAAAWQIRTFRL